MPLNPLQQPHPFLPDPAGGTLSIPQRAAPQPTEPSDPIVIQPHSGQFGCPEEETTPHGRQYVKELDSYWTQHPQPPCPQQPPSSNSLNHPPVSTPSLFTGTLHGEESSPAPAVGIGANTTTGYPFQSGMPRFWGLDQGPRAQCRIQDAVPPPRLSLGPPPPLTPTQTGQSQGEHFDALKGVVTPKNLPVVSYSESLNVKCDGLEDIFDHFMKNHDFSKDGAMFKLVSDPSNTGQMMYAPCSNEQCEENTDNNPGMLESSSTDQVDGDKSVGISENGVSCHDKELTPQELPSKPGQSDELPVNFTLASNENFTADEQSVENLERSCLVQAQDSLEDCDSGLGQSPAESCQIPTNVGNTNDTTDHTADIVPAKEVKTAGALLDTAMDVVEGGNINSIEMFECNKCSKTFTGLWFLLCTHLVEDHHKDFSKECDLCGYAYTTGNGSEVGSHFRKVHGAGSFVDPSQDGLFNCTHCPEVHCNSLSFLFHLEEDHPQTLFQCCRCPFMTSHRYQIARHMQSRHHQTNFHKCIEDIMEVECNLVCTSSCVPEGSVKCRVCHLHGMDEDLNQHLICNHQEALIKEQFPCYQCGIVTASYTDLGEHQREMHDNGVALECLYCLMWFPSIALLKEHCLYTHLRKSNFFCEHCLQYFRNPALLKKHRQLYYHAGDIAFIFGDKNIVAKITPLDQVLPAVLDCTSYDCNTCEQTFNSWINLCTHKLGVHDTPTERYCSLCALVFLKASTTAIHMKIVHGLTNFVNMSPDGYYHCQSCAEKFTFDLPYLFHLEEKHLGTAVTCPCCPYTTMHRYPLEQHKKQHHGGSTMESIPRDPQRKVAPNQSHMCALCGTVVEGPSVCMHLRASHPDALTLSWFPCRLCDSGRVTYTAYSALNKHVCTVHCRIKTGVLCPVCKQRFTDEKKCDVHFKSVHKMGLLHVETFPCRICGKRFKNRHFLQAHKWKHTNEKSRRSLSCS